MSKFIAMTRQSKPATGNTKRELRSVFKYQIMLLLIFTGLTAGFETDWARSLFSGGLIQMLPAMYLAWRLFQFSGAGAAQRITQSLYRGEAGKFVLTAGGFALAFTFLKPLFAPALFAGYMLMLVCHVLIVATISR